MNARSIAALAVLALMVGCDTSPPPMPVARQVKNRTVDVVGAVGQNQDQIGRAADQITGDVPKAGAGDKTFAVSGVEFIVPSGWTALPVRDNGMRMADLKVTSDDGREAHAVFFALKGDAASNINRWKGQVRLNPGTTPWEGTEEIAGLTVSRVSMVGTYAGMTPSGEMGEPEPNTRFIGIVIEGGRTSIQIRFTGPDDIVKGAEGAFNGMIEGMKRGG